MKPIRVQRKRTKGWRMPPNTVYVGRGSAHGNPHKIGNPHPDTGEPITREEAVELFKLDMFPEQKTWTYDTEVQHMAFHRRRIKEELSGKNLACWCPLDQPCHADVLLEIANET